MDASDLQNVIAYSAQVACVAAVGSILPFVLRLAPVIRYHYWRALLAVCVALPWLQGKQAVSSSATTIITSVQISAASGAGADPASAATALARIDWPFVAGIVLGGGIVLRLVWIAVSLFRLRLLRSAGTRADASEHDDLQGALGTRAHIRYLSDLRQPVTFGVLRPVVLLPESLRSHGPDIQRAVVCHELLHVQRRDWAWVLVEELVRAALWFHPATWWLLSRVQLAREEVVDETAVLATGTRRTYMEALMAFADDAPLAPAAAFSRRRHLFRRIVLLSKETVMSSRQFVFSVFVMTLVVAGGSAVSIGLFPMAEAAAAQQLLPAAGPAEQRAKPITPENPIPRRIYSVNPQYPFEAANVEMAGTVIVKVTLNGSGRITEARRAGFSVSAARPRALAVTRLGDPMTSVSEALSQMSAAARAADPQAAAVAEAQNQLAPAIEALFRSAADALQQWQYDSPTEAPIAFYVQLEFRPDAETRLVSQSPDRILGGTATGRGGATAVVVGGAQGGVRGGVPGGVRGGTPSGVPGGVPSVAPPPPPPPPGAPIRVGGNIAAPKKIKDVKPVYPAIAQSARISGIVIAEVTVGADGRVTAARVIRSTPLLDQAALDAVRQWEFTPTLLNGVPTPIIMTVTVNFHLDLAPPQQ